MATRYKEPTIDEVIRMISIEHDATGSRNTIVINASQSNQNGGDNWSPWTGYIGQDNMSGADYIPHISAGSVGLPMLLVGLCAFLALAPCGFISLIVFLIGG